MADRERIGRLEIAQDFDGERRAHRVRLVAAGAGLVLLALAVLGAFGGGFLSGASARSADGRLSADYERFLRIGSSTRIVLRFDAQRGGTSEVSIPRSHLAAFTVDATVPEPAETEVRGDRVVYAFASAGPAATVELQLTPRSVGLQRAEIRGPGETDVALTQFVYP